MLCVFCIEYYILVTFSWTWQFKSRLQLCFFPDLWLTLLLFPSSQWSLLNFCHHFFLCCFFFFKITSSISAELLPSLHHELFFIYTTLSVSTQNLTSPLLQQKHRGYFWVNTYTDVAGCTSPPNLGSQNPWWCPGRPGLPEAFPVRPSAWSRIAPSVGKKTESPVLRDVFQHDGGR